MNTLKKISYIFNKKQKVDMIILFIIMFIGGFVELLGVSAILPLVNVITDPSIINTNQKYFFVYNLFHMNSAREFVLYVSAALIIIYILKNIFILEMNNLQFRFTHNNQRRLAYRLMSCYMRQDYLFHVSRNSADLQRNLVQDVSNFFSTVLYVLQLMSEIIVCVMLATYLMIVDWATTLGVVLLVGTFAIIFYAIYKKRLEKGGKRYRMLNGLIYKWIQQSLGGIKEIKLMNREEAFLHTFDTNYEKSMRTMRKQRMINLLPKPLMETLCICGLLAIISIRIMSGADMTQFVPTLSVFALAAFRMLPSFNKITTQLSNIMFSKASVDSIYQELQETDEAEARRIAQKKIDENIVIDFKDSINLQHVYFAYPETDKDVIHDVSLVIPKNKSVAFIGTSGSGKTTLIDLILGVLTPDKGEILSDQTDIQRNLSAWHDKLGYIPQNIYLMDDSIKNNIAFGMPEKEIDENKIWEALREAQLEDFVKTLPEGMNTQIGEKGVKLSGGQRQRIGIARTLFHNPEILVMDEATSALDNETEQGVMEAVSDLSGTKTMIIVAHRLTTIVNCDIIYEVRQGMIRHVEREEVMAQISKKDSSNKE